MQTTTRSLRVTLASALLAGGAMIGTGAYAAAADSSSTAAAADHEARQHTSMTGRSPLTHLYRPRFAEPLSMP
jgi:hypothetical protein